MNKDTYSVKISKRHDKNMQHTPAAHKNFRRNGFSSIHNILKGQKILTI